MALSRRVEPLVVRTVWWAARSPGRRRLLERLAQEIDEAVETTSGDERPRTLYQMRLLSPPAAPPAATEPFRPGLDEAALLGLIGRAFAWHPEEQWDGQRLRRELDTVGNPPDAIRLAWEGPELAGFCWTRLHRRPTGPVGELVIAGVDPARAGRGLGTATVAAGVAHLRSQHVHHVYLYVESSNVVAVRTYLRLGFEVYRAERRYGEAPLLPPGQVSESSPERRPST
ncbi:GNAT family N-acetyltransferase [Acidiferrimicrobium sp. IK]|uniref:GNAT family N-acetyltransferase n=1 Tax=Acidiferrimicrobium sp. IK TaxID=2871700 RepID=UPI0021CB8FDB|nr:GNAT family N-acetyltransferase [Acidiferrimicrobium sp. IK]MCU4186170.1 GNAT family N-acetyltransferase [Acidiferrimicrobium sp. IK]